MSPCAAAAADELCQFQLWVRLNERDAHELERQREREREMSEMEEERKDWRCFMLKLCVNRLARI